MLPGIWVRARHLRRLRSLSSSAIAGGSSPFDAVVKIYSVNAPPNHVLPWQRKPQREATGSGFVLPDRHILTNAHVVADQNLIQVRKHGGHTKFAARTKFVNHDCDLALLEIEDPDFWDDNLPSLDLGNIPKLQDKIVVAGYPSCGDNLCVTSGVVSRVEPQQYCHGASSLLAVQIDAAINPGNSGGPALLDGKVAGVAFQTHLGSENCGFIIPVPVIRHFLEQSCRPGNSAGFCSLGLNCQPIENAALRAFLKLTEPGIGILVNKVRPLSPAAGHIRPNDVLVSFDGHRIASDGTITWRRHERVPFDHLVSMKFAGETSRVELLRDGALVVVDFCLFPETQLVPVHQYDRAPQYFVAGGLVFTPLVQPFLHEFGEDWYHRSPRKLCDLAMNATMNHPGEQVVILNQVLTHPVNVGYADLINLQVVRFGEVRLQNLAHLVELYDQACRRGQTFCRIELEDRRIVALRLDAVTRALPEILQRHGVPADRSADLQLPHEPIVQVDTKQKMASSTLS